jgi:hypothetical protein
MFSFIVRKLCWTKVAFSVSHCFTVAIALLLLLLDHYCFYYRISVHPNVFLTRLWLSRLKGRILRVELHTITIRPQGRASGNVRLPNHCFLHHPLHLLSHSCLQIGKRPLILLQVFFREWFAICVNSCSTPYV